MQYTTKHLTEMSEVRNFPVVPGPSKTYLILSTQRSGSTLVSRVLYETKAAGDPLEWFNQPLLQYAQEHFCPDLNPLTFLGFMKTLRTSPNGMFGCKVHYGQFEAAFLPEHRSSFLQDQDCIIRMRRRDMIEQAVSLSIAETTGIWSSEDDRFKAFDDSTVVITDAHLLKAYRRIQREEQGWTDLLAAKQLNELNVWYEDLVADYDVQFRLIFDYLGINDPAQTIARDPIVRQETKLNGVCHARLTHLLIKL